MDEIYMDDLEEIWSRRMMKSFLFWKIIALNSATININSSNIKQHQRATKITIYID